MLNNAANVMVYELLSAMKYHGPAHLSAYVHRVVALLHWHQ